MKKFIFSIFGLFIAQVAFSQEPVLLDGTSTIEFGTITASTKQPLYFKITNKSESSLLISEVRTSFGYDATYFPESLASGAIDSIGFTIDISKLNGPFRKTISLVSNTSNGITVFTIAGRVED